MPSFVSRRSISGRARLAITVLVLLMTLQAFAAAALATLGPTHTHRSAPTMLVLDDARRGAAHGESAVADAARRHGHSHDGTSLRHHHAPGDDTVRLADGEAALHAGDADDAGSGAAFGALIAVLPDVVAWLPRDGREVVAMRRAWEPQIHHPAFPERPPRAA